MIYTLPFPYEGRVGQGYLIKEDKQTMKVAENRFGLPPLNSLKASCSPVWKVEESHQL